MGLNVRKIEKLNKKIEQRKTVDFINFRNKYQNTEYASDNICQNPKTINNLSISDT